jgi:hypothetical protein
MATTVMPLLREDSWACAYCVMLLTATPNAVHRCIQQTLSCCSHHACRLHAGLVRFASEQYSSSKSSLKHATMHLTNYSINKKAPNFKQPGSSTKTANTGSSKQQQQQDVPANDADGGAADNASGSDADDYKCSDSDSSGSETTANKWRFGQLAEHLQQQGHAWDTVWQQVCCVHQCGSNGVLSNARCGSRCGVFLSVGCGSFHATATSSNSMCYVCATLHTCNIAATHCN